MTSTNRFLNRLFALLVGVMLLAAGAALAVGALWPDVQQTVSQAAADAVAPATDALSGGAPWILWAVAAGALLLIVLLVVFMLRQGRGRTSTLLDVREGDERGRPTGGHVIIDASVAGAVLREALSTEPGIVSTDVTAFRVRRQTVLRITANARRGASPSSCVARSTASSAQWDSLLGEPGAGRHPDRRRGALAPLGRDPAGLATPGPIRTGSAPPPNPRPVAQPECAMGRAHLTGQYAPACLNGAPASSPLRKDLRHDRHHPHRTPLPRRGDPPDRQRHERRAPARHPRQPTRDRRAARRRPRRRRAGRRGARRARRHRSPPRGDPRALLPRTADHRGLGHRRGRPRRRVPRPNPVELRRTIDRVVEQWDALLGASVPVVIQIVGGVRSSLSAGTRLD